MSTETPILHVDMDAFFVSVEQVRQPELLGKPVAVGGDGHRGVVAAASYEARVHGVYSAMSSREAQRLCPDLIFLQSDHAHYSDISERIMLILNRFTPLVEPLSLDEAFLDVRGAKRLFGEPETIALQIKKDIFDTEGLPCSVGIAANKFLAKLASKKAKPQVSRSGLTFGSGVYVLDSSEVESFLKVLPITEIWGIGRSTEKKLRRFGVTTVSEMLLLDEETLTLAVGQSAGSQLWNLARGIDDRIVTPERIAKSIGREETFPVDLYDSKRLEKECLRMVHSVVQKLRKKEMFSRTVVLKIRYKDFTTISRSRTFENPTNSNIEISKAVIELLSAVDFSPGVRLLGVSVNGLGTGVVRQLAFDEVDTSKWEKVERAVDVIRNRFGGKSIHTAGFIEEPDR